MTIDDGDGGRVFYARDFALTKRALDKIKAIRGEYLQHSPNNPPVLAGFAFAAPIGDSGKLGQERLVVGFWQESQVTKDALAAAQHVGGIDFLLFMPTGRSRDLAGKVVDYSPERAFFATAAD